MSELCVKCGIIYVNDKAEDVRRGNGLCSTCAGARRPVEAHAVICADRRIHGLEGPGDMALFPDAEPAKLVCNALNEGSRPCGPHRIVRLRSNRLRVLASNLDHAHGPVMG